MPRVDLVSKVTQQLEEAILSGEYQPGDRLPAERAICVQMGVSRSVVREAIGRLASLGLVLSVHGSRTLVQPPSGKPILSGYQRLLAGGQVNLEHLAEVRLPLETTIAELAAARRTQEHLTRLEATQANLGNPKKSLESHVKADLEFHAILAEATGNPLFQMVLAPMQELLITSRRWTLGRYGPGVAFQHHGRILAAVAAQDTAHARQTMLDHLAVNIAHLHGEERGKVVRPL